MRHSKHDRFWALKYTAQMISGAFLALVCLVIAIAAPGYFGRGGIALPTVALIGMSVWVAISLRALFRLSDEYHERFDSKDGKHVHD